MVWFWPDEVLQLSSAHTRLFLLMKKRRGRWRWSVGELKPPTDKQTGENLDQVWWSPPDPLLQSVENTEAEQTGSCRFWSWHHLVWRAHLTLKQLKKEKRPLFSVLCREQFHNRDSEQNLNVWLDLSVSYRTSEHFSLFDYIKTCGPVDL